MTLRLLAASLLSSFGGAGEVMAEVPASPVCTGQPATFAAAGRLTGGASDAGSDAASGISQAFGGNDLRVIPAVSKGPVEDVSGLPALMVAEVATGHSSATSPAPLKLKREEAIEPSNRGKPDAGAVSSGIDHRDKVDFLDVYLRPLQGNYLPAIIPPEDYPNLVSSKESIATFGGSHVLAIRDQPPQSERQRVMAGLAARFLSGFRPDKEAGFGPKWNEVSLRGPIVGRQRFEPAALGLSGVREQAAVNARPAAQMNTIEVEFVERWKSAATRSRGTLQSLRFVVSRVRPASAAATVRPA
jgi:hypothetical protein